MNLKGKEEKKNGEMFFNLSTKEQLKPEMFTKDEPGEHSTIKRGTLGYT